MGLAWPKKVPFAKALKNRGTPANAIPPLGMMEGMRYSIDSAPSSAAKLRFGSLSVVIHERRGRMQAVEAEEAEQVATSSGFTLKSKMAPPNLSACFDMAEDQNVVSATKCVNECEIGRERRCFLSFRDRTS